MKNFFLIVAVFFVFFKLLLQPVYSQTVIPFSNAPIPGQTCGNPVATNPEGKRCCYFQPKTVAIQKPGILGIDQLIDLLSPLFNRFVDPVVNPLNKLITDTVQPCIDSTPSTPGDIGNPSCICVKPTASPLENIKPLCENIDRTKNDNEYNDCLDCLSGKSGPVGVWTGLGCVYTDTRSFLEKTVFGFGIGLAGGFALLCIIYAAFLMQSSQGNPEQLKKAQEMITSCIMGLMLIIFSVFILRLIGINILRIPGFQ